MKITNISGLVALSVLVSEVAAAPAPVIVTVWETQEEAAPTAPAAPVASYAPVAHAPAQAQAQAPVASYAPVQAASPVASAPVAQAPAQAPAQSPASSPAAASSDGPTTIDNLFSRIFAYFGIGGSGSAPKSAPSVTTTSTASVIPYAPVSSSQAPVQASTYAPFVAPWKTTSSSSVPTPSSSSGSGTGSGSIGSVDDPAFAKDILDAHNKYRGLHGSGPLSWDDSAYQYAQNNADHYDCSGVLTHTHGQFGENLAAGYSSGSSAVKAWYDEGETYNYGASNSYDHFTQVVWKASTKVGCAWKDCTAQNWGHYVICEYDPPGNMIGESRANVLPN